MKLASLKAGHNFQNLLLAVHTVNQGVTRNDDLYLRLEVSDGTDKLQAMFWNYDPDIHEYLLESELIKASGHCEVYNEQKQLVLSRADEYEASPQELKDLLPTIDEERIDDLSNRIRQHFLTITDDTLWAVLEEAFRQYDEAFMTFPASTRVHHDYVGGLLHHVVEMLDISDSVISLWPDLNADLLKTGIVLHDIGKLQEYRLVPGFKKTNNGQLTGHVCLGWRMIDDICRRAQIENDNPDWWDEGLTQKLLAMILSHHGKREWGSPEVPKFPEAVALHLIDMISSKVTIYLRLIEEASSGDWTPYNRLIKTKLFRS